MDRLSARAEHPAELSLREDSRDELHVCGPTQLSGEVPISGAKNAALPILFGALLTEFPVRIGNVPRLEDVDVAVHLLRKIGVKIQRKGSSVHIDAAELDLLSVSPRLMGKIRASVWLLAPLLVRCGRAEITSPGGCRIGRRPVDLHVDGLRKLGADVTVRRGHISATAAGRLRGAPIDMRRVSFGATITLMMAAVLARGVTTIRNAARDPEVVDTANFLTTLGADIGGAGTSNLTIRGVDQLGGGVHSLPPDRIEIGTFLIAAAASRGEVICRPAQAETLRAVLDRLREVGARIETGEDWVSLDMRRRSPKAIVTHTAPYPGFPTDLQPQLSLLNVLTRDGGRITENVFENRLMHIRELRRMGALVEVVDGRTIRCRSGGHLSGAKVTATDLRSSASLLIAGCVARGMTVVEQYFRHARRGYEGLEGKLSKLGAAIEQPEKIAEAAEIIAAPDRSVPHPGGGPRSPSSAWSRAACAAGSDLSPASRSTR